VFLPDKQILVISHQATPWYANLVNFKVYGVLPSGLSHQQRKKLLSDAKYYMWEEPLFYKLCGDGVYRRCLPDKEMPSVLHHCHAFTYGGHFGSGRPLQRLSKQVFIGPQSSKIQEDLS